jgi:hypothetical protein
MSSPFSDSRFSRSRFACACASRTLRRTSCLDSILAIVANLRPARRQALTVAATFPATRFPPRCRPPGQSDQTPVRGSLRSRHPKRWLPRPRVGVARAMARVRPHIDPPVPQSDPLRLGTLTSRANAAVGGTASTAAGIPLRSSSASLRVVSDDSWRACHHTSSSSRRRARQVHLPSSPRISSSNPCPTTESPVPHLSCSPARTHLTRTSTAFRTAAIVSSS